MVSSEMTEVEPKEGIKLNVWNAIISVSVLIFGALRVTFGVAYAISPENGYVIVVASGVLTGAIFGDHCSPISDTTILSSMGTACDHIEHTKTQMYYAITVGIITILFGYIPAGFGLSIYLVLPISIVALITTIFILGKKVDVRI